MIHSPVQSHRAAFRILASSVAFAIVAAVPVRAGGLWDGGGGNANWGTPGNWDNDTLPSFGSGADIVFAGGLQPSNFLGSARTIRSLTFNSAADSTVTIRTTSTATSTTAANLTFDGGGAGAAVTVDADSAGAHIIGVNATGGSIVLADNLIITNSGTEQIQFAREIVGSGKSITKEGPGRIILGTASSGSSTFSGGVILNGGVIQVNNATGLGTGTVTLNNTGVTLRQAAITIANDVVISDNGDLKTLAHANAAAAGYTGSLTIHETTANHFQIDVLGAGNLVLSGLISGPGGFERVNSGTGAGLLRLSAANTHSGPTKAGAGVLQLGHLFALQNSALDTGGLGTVDAGAGSGTYVLGGLTSGRDLADVVTNDANITTLRLNPQTGAVTYNDRIANLGANMSVEKSGAGTQVLGGANGYTGTTSVRSGTLLINGSQTAATGALVVGGSTATGTPSLGGTGTLGGDVIVSSADGGARGTLAPGGTSSGTLSLNNRNLTLQSGALLRFRIGSASDAVAGVNSLALNGQQWSDCTFIPDVGFTTGTYPLVRATSVSGSLGFVVSGSLAGLTGTLAVDANNDLILIATDPSNTYPVTYDANGADGGTAPPAQNKIGGIPLILAPNSGNLVRSGFRFAGWNTAASGAGTDFAEGASYASDAALALYAKWIPAATYTVTYDANGATSGTVPPAQIKTEGEPLTLAVNSSGLAKDGLLFAGWNTAADGSGTDYAEAGSYSGDSSVVLYAKWSAIPVFSVTYQANGAIGGSVPAAQTKTHGIPLVLATNSGSLLKTGFTFSGWNTAADGSGTNYDEGGNYAVEADAVLYAKWTATGVTYSWDGEGTDTDWIRSANWAGNPVLSFTNTTDLVFYTIAGSGTNTTDSKLRLFTGASSKTIRSLTFNSSAYIGVVIQLTRVDRTTPSNLTFDGGGGGATISTVVGSSAAHQIGVAGGNFILADNLLISHRGIATLTLDRPFNESGGARSLTKNGRSPVVLGGANSYTGPTLVREGALFINGNQSAAVGTVTVGGASASGAPRLGGTGTIGGNVVIAAASGGAAGTLSPGSLAASGTMSLANRALTLETGAKLAFRLGTQSDVVSGVDVLALNGQQWSDFSITEAPGFGPGTYPLVTAVTVTGSLGAIVNGTLRDGRTGTLSIDENHDLVLTVTGAPAIPSFSASPAVISSGSSTSISWTSRGADSLILTRPDGAVDVTGTSPDGVGSLTVAPASTATYLLTASNAHGSTSASLTITVLPPGFRRPNFLFIAIDDLKPICGHMSEEPGNILQKIYPDPVLRAQKRAVLTPNMDRLANEGVSFLRAYTPSAYCNPARASIMTGIRPHASGFLDNVRGIFFRDYSPLFANAVTLPQHLRANGYYAVGVGKIFHHQYGRALHDFPLSWDKWVEAWDSGTTTASVWTPNASWGTYSLPLEGMWDYKRSDIIARLLESGTVTVTDHELNQAVTVTLPPDKPFFLGCGIYHPHSPYTAPSSLLNQFPLSEITYSRQMAQEATDDLLDLPPTGLDHALASGLQGIFAHGLGRDPVDGDLTAMRDFIRHYLASVALADRCVGRLINALDNGPYADNTVVALWSDHGFNLGEKSRIGKTNLWESGNNAVFIMRAPGKASGQRCYRVVSTGDLYRTLCSLAGLTPPTIVSGADISPLLANPQRSWSIPALSSVLQPDNNSLRTESFRFIRYNGDSSESELYDMTVDPNEITNLATLPQYATTRMEMEARLGTALLQGSVSPTDPPFTQWRMVKFTEAELTDPQISGPEADPDHDGLVNLLEYAFGSEPRSAASRVSLIPSLDGDYGHITYRHSKAAGGAVILPESSGDLKTWSSPGLTEVGRIDRGTYWEVTVRDAVPFSEANHRFLRLRVTQP